VARHPRVSARALVPADTALVAVLELGRTGPFLVDGAVAGLGADGRPEHPPLLDNPAVRVPHGGQRLEADWGGHRLVLDLVAGHRLEPSSGTA
jgi:hypothetical protein